MRKYITILALTAALGLQVSLAGAGIYTIGKMKLSGTVLEWDLSKLTITAQGKASFTSLGPDGPIKPGAMQLKSVKADSIRLILDRSKDNAFTAKEAVATGGVLIDARQASEETDQQGEKRTVIRNLHAAAQTATMREGQDMVVLTGNVVIKLTEPGVSEPVAVINGRTVSMSLKDNKIRVEGQSDKPAELTVTPKEDEAK